MHDFLVSFRLFRFVRFTLTNRLRRNQRASLICAWGWRKQEPVILNSIYGQGFKPTTTFRLASSSLVFWRIYPVDVGGWRARRFYLGRIPPAKISWLVCVFWPGPFPPPYTTSIITIAMSNQTSKDTIQPPSSHSLRFHVRQWRAHE